MTDRVVAEFNAAHGRDGVIAVCEPGETCHACGGSSEASIAIDSSEGEYGCGVICFRCLRMLDAAIDEMKKCPPGSEIQVVLGTSVVTKT